jgi:hypothetical protein
MDTNRRTLVRLANLIPSDFRLGHYNTLLQSLPNWIVQKIQLWPTGQLNRKLSCLKFQLEQCDTAADIEDHFMHIGISKADLTYLNSDGTLTFIDVTTSSSQTLIDHKHIQLREQVDMYLPDASVQVLQIPVSVTVNLIEDLPAPSNILDKFNNLILASDTHTQNRFNSTLEFTVRPILHKAMTNIPEYVPPTRQSSIVVETDSLPNDWNLLEPDVSNLLKEALSIVVSGPDLEHPLMPPIAISEYKPTSILDTTDPGIVMLRIALGHTSLKREVAYAYYPDSNEFVIKEENTKQARKLFKYTVDGAMKCSSTVLADPSDKVIWFILSKEDAVDPKGQTYPKALSFACGSGWKGYIAHAQRRKFTGTTKNDRVLLSHPNVSKLEEAQHCVNTLESSLAQHDGGINTLGSKYGQMAKTVLSRDDLGIPLGVLKPSKEYLPTTKVEVSKDLEETSKRKSKPHALNSNLFCLLSQQYEIARAISNTLKEKHCGYGFRVVKPTGMSHAMLVGTGNGIHYMTTVPIIWDSCCDSLKFHKKMANMSLSLNKRLLEWWLKLPHVYYLVMNQFAQRNLRLSPSHPDLLYESTLIKYGMNMLTTRQQESLMKDQLRYILAGALSPDSEFPGPLKKCKDIKFNTPTELILYANLAVLHSKIYLHKELGASSTSLDLKSDLPPRIASPMSGLVAIDWQEFIDGMFASKIFNKMKPQKLNFQAEDWYDLLKTDIEYKETKQRFTSFVRGYSSDFEKLLLSAVANNNLTEVIDDIKSSSSVWIKEIEEWPTNNVPEFGWCAAITYTVAVTRLKGKRLESLITDYSGVFGELGRSSLTSFLSSAGATLGMDPTDSSQSARKSSAVLQQYISKYNPDTPLKQVGPTLTTIITNSPDNHQSLFSEFINLLCNGRKNKILSRTEDKEQSGGNREFSAMNAIGIISCRVTERIVNTVLPKIPTDMMSHAHSEKEFEQLMKSGNHDRNLYIAADNSRFGPNQNMAKNRIVLMALCMTDNTVMYDQDALLFLFRMLAEAPSLMESKISKMPNELREFIITQGGYAKIFNHNPESIYGKLAGLVLQHYGPKHNSFCQEWGMYQGALGMMSSLASSLLHDEFVDIITNGVSCNAYCDTAVAMVTNDDSAIRLYKLPDEITIKQVSHDVKKILKNVLRTGGQILNEFKTVCSTKLGEFHTHFCSPTGYIVPELKILFAALQIPRGESLSKDAKSVIESGITAIREGCTLMSANSVCLSLSVLFADMYNRWPSIRRNGFRPAELGGPVFIDLPKEMVLPNFGSYKWFDFLSSKDTISKWIAQSLVLDEEDELYQLANPNTINVTKSISKISRGRKEIAFEEMPFALPLTSSCTNIHMGASISSGLLSNQRELGIQSDLVRYSRNQVSYKNINFRYPSGTWVATILGATDVSQEMLDNITPNMVNNLPDPSVSTSTLLDAIAISVFRQMQAVTALIPTNLSTGKLLRVGSKHKSTTFKRHMVVKTPPGYKKLPALPRAIEMWGTDRLKTLLHNEMRSKYDYNEAYSLQQDIRSVNALSIVTSKAVKQRAGPYVLQTDKTHMSVADAAISVSAHSIKGLIMFHNDMSQFSDEIERAQHAVVVDTDQTELSTASVITMLTSGTVPIGQAFRIPPQNAHHIFTRALPGWHTYRDFRVKVRRMAVPQDPRSDSYWTPFALVTVKQVINYATFYKHFVLGVDNYVDSRNITNWPHEFLGHHKLQVGQDYASNTTHDIIHVCSQSDLDLVIFKQHGYTIFAIYPELCVPVHRIKPAIHRIEPAVYTIQQASEADASMLFSLLQVEPTDQRCREESTKLLTKDELINRAQEFTSMWLYNWLVQHPMEIPILEQTPNGDTQRWKLCASRISKFISTQTEIEEVTLTQHDVLPEDIENYKDDDVDYDMRGVERGAEMQEGFFDMSNLLDILDALGAEDPISHLFEVDNTVTIEEWFDEILDVFDDDSNDI